MASEKAGGGMKPMAEMTEEEVGKVVERSVVTSVYSHGDLVFEPGMSREEERIRTRYALWRHVFAEKLDATTAKAVEMKILTEEQAVAHKARVRREAEEDRLYVERADAARAERLRSGAKPRDDGPTR